jgi:hypothetical protein
MPHWPDRRGADLVAALPGLLSLMAHGGGLSGRSASASLFARSQGVQHCLSEGAGNFGAEIAGFAQDHLSGSHAESAGRLRSCE